MTSPRDGSRAAVPAMMALYMLALLAIGMLRPVRNALALDGLGQTDFYKVYLVSALAVVFVPMLDRLSERVALRRLIPGVALFFALNLLVFHVAYVEGSTSFGLIFYGWYDLFAAGLVTQFFMVTQVFFHARLARRAYPLVIAAGALGASAGGAVTGFLAERLGTPNLLLIAAAIVAAFALALAAVWSIEDIEPSGARSRPRAAAERAGSSLRTVFADRQVQLIAGLVLLTVLVKQLVDYQFNTITKEVFVERDAIGAFQGKFSAATQWLPIVVLAGMRAPLRRWGVGFVVLMLPVAMLLTNVALLLFWGLWAAVAAKGMEGSLRYSAERTGREILYLPVRDGIKTKAKVYIDMAVEKGVGKVASALLIFGWIAWADYRDIALLGAALALVWIGIALAVRGQYVRTLAYAVEQRFASLTSTFASLADRNVVSMLRQALAGDPRQIAFALNLLGQASDEDTAALVDELAGLLTHPRAPIRRRALDLLARVPGAVAPETYRQRLGDADADVREAAVRALLAAQPDHAETLLAGLLDAAEQDVRIATLACLARGEIGLPTRALTELAPSLRDAPRSHDGAEASDRIERVLAAAALRPPDAARIVAAHIDDPDEAVARAAVRSAGLLGERGLYARMISALGPRALRSTAREALALQGTAVVPVLAAHLLDTGRERTVRRQIPSVLARIPAPETVPALVRCVLSAETDQTLDHRAIKALSQIRARHAELRFEPSDVDALLSHSLDAAREYASAGRQLHDVESAGPRTRLLVRALEEAWAERREEVFRCLGLRYAPADVHRCYLAVVRGETVPRANALEWLENTMGHRTFTRLAPVLGDAAHESLARDPAEALERLGREQDRWIAGCAAAAAVELGAATAEGADARVMDTVQRVLLLQQTDVLADARSAYLALVARIAEEIDVEAGTALIEKDRPADGLYIVVSGEVAATGAGEELRFTDGMAFGAWSLIDALPSVVAATSTQPTRLLHVDREEFLDLLADHPELAIGMLQGLAKRVRALAR